MRASNLITNPSCSFICSDKYLIDPVHPADTHANTPTHSSVIFHVVITQQEQSEVLILLEG